MKDEQPDRKTLTTISAQELAALQARLRREQPADPRNIGSLRLPVAEEQLRDELKK